MRCQKCQLWCDSEDAFCRRCGAPTAQEATFYEAVAAAPVTIVEAQVVEISEPAGQAQLVENNAVTAIQLAEPSQLATKPGVKSRMLGLATKALGSEEGKALVKGAAVLAVSVGLELLSHSRQPRSTQVPTPEALFRPEITDLAEPFNPPPGTTVVETWTYRYTYMRRVVRRVR